MTRNHWKYTAGALALGLGGLAAVADMPAKPDRGAVTTSSPDTLIACGGPAVPTVAPSPSGPVVLQPPVEVHSKPSSQPLIPVPTAPETPVPSLTPAGVSTPAELPPVPAPTRPNVAAVSGGPAEVIPMPRKATEKLEFTLPLAVESAGAVAPVSGTAPVPAPVTPALPEAPKPQPAPSVTPAIAPPEPTPAPKAVPPVNQTAQPQPLTEPVPAPAPAQLPTQTATSRPAAGEPALPAHAEPLTTVIEKKLKVMLFMGDERPRFEVRDGDEVYLKVVCDKIDVKSPSEKGETMSVMRAGGKVAFVTPGGEGVCDELTVAPGTGQVMVTGKVTFKHNWGKVETTVSSDRMMFRLGTAPGVVPASGGSTTIPTAFQR